MKKYLPSKKFMYLIGSFLVLAVVFFIAFKLLSNKNSFTNKRGLGIDRMATAGLTVNELIQKDSDNDGIPDWEEALWGTDKNKVMTFAGLTDKAYIEGKKKELNVDQTKDENGLTETEKFAREFFTAYVAMKASGTVDADAINNFSNALGEKIVNPILSDQYSLKDIKTSNGNTQKEKLKYYNNVKTVFEKYKIEGLGDELNIINEQLTASVDTKNDDELTPIGKAYQDFAKAVTGIMVPNDLVNEHLKIINSANNTGISVLGMTKITGDPIVGLSGISQYQKYSDELVSAVRELETKIKQ